MRSLYLLYLLGSIVLVLFLACLGILSMTVSMAFKKKNVESNEDLDKDSKCPENESQSNKDYLTEIYSILPDIIARHTVITRKLSRLSSLAKSSKRKDSHEVKNMLE